MATFVHFDISAAEPEMLRNFYEKLFDWKFEATPAPLSYYLVETKGIDGKPGLGGGMAKADGGPGKGIVNYIGVASVDKVLEQVEELGGKIIQPKQPIPGYGVLALCEDIEGNRFGIFQEVR